MRHTAIAAAVTLLAAGSALADWDDDCKYTAPRNLTTPSAGVTKVVIHAESGSLQVDGTPGVTEIVASGIACTSDDDFIDRMTLRSRRSGSELHISAEIPEKTILFGFFQARLDFAVTLPAGLPVAIDDDSGWIKVSNVGATTINDDSGSIELRNVQGALVIHDDSGSVDIDTVAGNVKIEDDSGEVIVKNVKGTVTIDDDSGAITVARVEGAVHIREDDSGSITVQNVRGDVTIDEDGSGGIEVADIGGNFTVGRKTSGGIDHVRVTGRVRVPTMD